MLIHAAAHSNAFKAIVSEGASGQSVRDGLANGDTLDAFLGGGPNTLATAVFTNTLPPPSLKSEIPKIAPTALFLVYGEKGQNGSETKPNQAVLRGCRRAEADLGSSERAAHRRDHHGAGRVRAARDRVLRRAPPGRTVTEHGLDGPSWDTTMGRAVVAGDEDSALRLGEREQVVVARIGGAARWRLAGRPRAALPRAEARQTRAPRLLRRACGSSDRRALARVRREAPRRRRARTRLRANARRSARALRFWRGARR